MKKRRKIIRRETKKKAKKRFFVSRAFKKIGAIHHDVLMDPIQACETCAKEKREMERDEKREREKEMEAGGKGGTHVLRLFTRICHKID